MSLPEDMSFLIMGYEPDLKLEDVNEIETAPKFTRAASRVSSKKANYP